MMSHASKLGPFFFVLAACCSTTARAADYVIDVSLISGAAGLEDALASARKHRVTNPSDSIRIRLEGGDYHLARPIQLTKADSGTDAAPLIIEGALDGTTVLSGSRVLAQDSDLSDTVTAGQRPIIRIDIARHPNIAPLGNLRFGTYAGRSGQTLALFQGDRHLMPARHPLSGFLTGNNVAPFPNMPNKFLLTNERAGTIDALPSDDDLWVAGYFARDWDFEVAHVEGRDSATSGLIVDRPSQLVTSRQDFRAFILNTTKGLTVPGAYVVERSGDLKLIPYDSKHALEIGEAKTVLAVTRAEYITLTRISFEKSADTIVKIESSKNITLQDCFIGLGGNNAAIVAGSKNIVIDRCVVSHLPSGGIFVYAGDRKTITPANVVVRDSVISDFNFMTRTYKPAVSLYGVGISVEGCLITGSPHVAVMFAGNNHHISDNEFFDLVTETDDASVIYAGRDWTQRGTRIERNYIHNIGSDAMKASSSIAIYLDDQFSGTTINDNIIFGSGTGVLIGGGRDNHVARNIFMAQRFAAISFDDRGISWQKSWGNSSTPLMQKLREIDISTPLWQQTYPELSTMAQDEPGAPKGNTASQNIVFGRDLVRYASPGARQYFTPTDTISYPMLESSELHDARALLARRNIPTMFDFTRRARLEKLLYFPRARVDTASRSPARN